jgi:hypothetical protein
MGLPSSLQRPVEEEATVKETPVIRMRKEARTIDRALDRNSLRRSLTGRAFDSLRERTEVR